MAMTRHVVFLVHGMGLQLDDSGVPGSAWHSSIIKSLDAAWSSFDVLQGQERQAFIEYVPITYDKVFSDYLKGVSSKAQALAKVMPPSKMQEFFDALGEAGEDPNFVWDDVVDVLLYRYGADLYRNLHVVVEKKIAEHVIETWDRRGQLGTRFSMVSHSLGTAVAHGALNRLGGGKIGKSAAFQLGGPFYLRTYMSLANVSRVLWYGEHELYGSTILRPPGPGRRGYCDLFLNVRHILDPFPMPKRFAPIDWGRAFGDMTVQHLHELNVHSYAHYLAHPRVAGLFLHSLLGKNRLPLDAIERACVPEKFEELALVGKEKREDLAKLRDKLAIEMRDAFGGDRGIVPSVAVLIGRAANLAWRMRQELVGLLA